MFRERRGYDIRKCMGPGRQEFCPERQHLAEVLMNAVDAIQAISRTYVQAQYKAGFADVLRRGDRVRIAADRARIALVSHTVEHRCR